MKNFIIEQDSNKKDTGCIPQADVIYNLVMTGSAMKTVTVPTGANIAIFSATGNFYCRFDAAVAVPAADIVDGTAGELNPVARVARRVTSINMISATDIIVTIAFYNVPYPQA